MARRARNVYDYIADDHGAQFPTYTLGVMVPVDLAAEAGRGWVLADGPRDTTQNRMKLRHVVGRSSDGHTAKAIVASIAADLWTGTSGSFVVDGVTYTVTGYIGEKRTLRAPRV